MKNLQKILLAFCASGLLLACKPQELPDFTSFVIGRWDVGWYASFDQFSGMQYQDYDSRLDLEFEESGRIIIHGDTVREGSWQRTSQHTLTIDLPIATFVPGEGVTHIDFGQYQNFSDRQSWQGIGYFYKDTNSSEKLNVYLYYWNMTRIPQ